MKKRNETSYVKYIYLRLIAPAVFTLLAFIFVIFFIFLPNYKQSIINSRELMTKELVETAFSMVNNVYSLYQEGYITEEEAKQHVKEHIDSIRYGKEKKDYFWINDLEPVMIMHPYRKDLEGKNVGDYHDVQGIYLFREFVKTVKEDGEGFVNYMWQWKDDPGDIVPKISYVKLFEPWGWIIGTGAYVEDIKAEVDLLSNELFQKCWEIVLVVFLIGMYGLYQIIRTEEARADSEEKLIKQEKMFRALTEKATDITLIFDKDHKIKYVNPFGLQGLYFREEDVLGVSYFDFIHPEDLPMIKKIAERAMEGTDSAGHIDNFRILDGQGQVHYLEGYYTYLLDQPEVEGIVFNGRDVTQKKEAEKLFVDANIRAQRVFENALEGIAMASLETRQFKHVNPSLCHMLGYNTEELLAMRMDDIHPREALHSILLDFESQSKGVTSLAQEVPCFKKNGELIYCDITAFPLTLDGELCNVGFFTDVTERRKITEELDNHRYHLEELVIQKSKDLILSEKLAVTGRFAAGIAHEINNPLQGMLINLEVLKDSFVENKDNAESYRYIKESINRIKHVVSQLLDIYRDKGGENKIFAINPLIKNVISFLSHQANARGITINMDLAEASPQMKGWRQQVYQVILNLLINAMESSQSGDVITIKAYKKEGIVIIEVEDHGKGIKDSNLEKVFEPFFSEGKSSGVGLGLFVCKGLIDNHHGSIDVFSKEGEGTKFIVKFPAA